MPARTDTAKGTVLCGRGEAMTSTPSTTANPGPVKRTKSCASDDPPRRFRRSGRDGGFSQTAASHPQTTQVRPQTEEQ